MEYAIIMKRKIHTLIQYMFKTKYIDTKTMLKN